ncbi:TetR/AcrR family transcriptional regulator [Caulobacter vibrioides]|uniref:Transcriptional regulator, TetR family n=2 Tax=Caulobacter vibrioides TaxID=155892 RepID=Q9A5V8_CAUVC|nr:TetR/AcrR family transcriptional regulator [Caulobacter vibrioides]YP_002517797.1 TetR-family transcriptional regulator [Caulobacter vibrioides NA1000]AAK24310.1 transcriptional regulator, TetR family [Caulobacter vibrioides CB15]ACL95889.1 TetR-family transcriptional regulator [Caulobacter vibrioides NA1000]ATC29201.1 TetR/AcrR family transcriptional regulator [Caulobacter vibrioides]QXZ50713.1 TetR/AcrR family transcriptional regulator [Caulobacter vibrioides]
MPRPERDLREACLKEALAIIEHEGVERLSLRDVARRLGVSHQAPYRHFPSRDHILAEVVARAFEEFARHLDAHPKSSDPDRDMGLMGEAYLAYAAKHPLQYQLMFATPLPSTDTHPEMMAKARHAFDMLLSALRRKAAEQGRSLAEEAIVLDALFIWSGLHGLAMLRNSSAFDTLGLRGAAIENSTAHLLSRFGDALGH